MGKNSLAGWNSLASLSYNKAQFKKYNKFDGLRGDNKVVPEMQSD
jgi:hypothetical protein